MPKFNLFLSVSCCLNTPKWNWTEYELAHFSEVFTFSAKCTIDIFKNWHQTFHEAWWVLSHWGRESGKTCISLSTNVWTTPQKEESKVSKTQPLLWGYFTQYKLHMWFGCNNLAQTFSVFLNLINLRVWEGAMSLFHPSKWSRLCFEHVPDGSFSF